MVGGGLFFVLGGHNMKKKLSPELVYYIYSGASTLFFSLVFTANLVYYVEKVGLNPLQLVLVGTMLETVYFLFEIPTGVVADVYSRRLSVIIGVILTGLGFLLEGFIPSFIAVLASQVLWGIGATFTSGAEEAWIADEMEGEDLDQVFLRGAQVGQVTSFIGIILSVLMASSFINIPIIIGGGMFIALAVFLIVCMPETVFHKTSDEERNTWGHMKNTLRLGLGFIGKSKLLVIILAISLFEGLYSEGFDRLWSAHFINDIGFPRFIELKSVVWFGIMNSIALLISMGATEIIKRYLKRSGKLSMIWLLFAINGAMSLSIIALGLSGKFALALIAYWSIYILRKANAPIYSAWINSNLQSEFRATILSIGGLLNSLGQIVGGPAVGLIAAKVSIGAGLATSGAILAPTLVLYLYIIYRSKSEGQ
jgi:MFS transporter, DHA3 family, tetracycline resistance protein